MADSDNENHKPVSMSLGEHLDELRRRILYALAGLTVAMILTLTFGKELIEVIKLPYVEVLEDLKMDAPPVALTVTDAFFTYFRVALLAGVLLASPWIFYQLWLFVAAGLHAREKRYVHWAVPFSALLFIGGALFFLKFVSFPMLKFFMGFSGWLDVKPVIQLKELIKFMTNLMLVFGLAFQTPILVFVLGKVGLVTTATLTRYRRHVIVAMLILAAMVTSPSPIDQVALALPMWLLYELGIALVYFFARKEEPEL